MRQDTKMPAEATEFAARARSACRGAVRRRGFDPRAGALLRGAADDRAARPGGGPARGDRPGRALRLRQVDPAGAGLRACRSPPPARSRWEAPATPRGRLARCAYMPQRDLLLPWFSAIDNAALALRNRGLRRSGGAAAGRRPVRALRPRRLRATPPRRALGRDAPAGRLPAHPCSPASRCWRSTSRSPRSTRSPGPRCSSGWPGRWRPTRAPSSSSPTTSRRRSTSPTGSPCSRRARRGSVEELSAPAPRAPDRDAAVTDPEFVAVRERAMRALRGSPHDSVVP